MNKYEKIDLKRCILCIIIAAAAFALGYYTTPVLLIVLTLFIPMAFIYLRAWETAGVTIVCTVVFGLLVWLMAGLNMAILATACTLLIALVSGYAIRKKWGMYFSLLATSGAMLAALGALALGIYLMGGNSLVDAYIGHMEQWYFDHPDVTRFVHYFTKTMEMMQQGGTVSLPAIEAIYEKSLILPMAELVEETLVAEREMTILYIPQICAMVIPLFGLLNYVIPRAIAKKQGRTVGKMPAFDLWRLPGGFGYFTLALLVIAMIGQAMEWNNFVILGTVIMGFLMVVYSIQGISFMEWLLKKGVRSKGARIVIIVFSFLLLMAINGYMWIGIVEQLLRLRAPRKMVG